MDQVNLDRVNRALSIVVRQVVPLAVAEENLRLKQVINEHLLNCELCKEYWPKSYGSNDCEKCGQHLCKDRRYNCICGNKCTNCVVKYSCPECIGSLCSDCLEICGLCGRSFCGWDFPNHDCS